MVISHNTPATFLVAFAVLCLAIYAATFISVQFRMKRAGYKTIFLVYTPSDMALPFKYLKVCSEYGWSPWLVYIMFMSLPLGLLALVVWLLRQT